MNEDKAMGNPDGSMQLQKLRFDTDTAVRELMFLVRPDATFGNLTVGGPCDIECTKLRDAVYALKPVGGSGPHYFFPYVQAGGGGVGHCLVPSGAAVGTLVITGGMNGCSLEVRSRGSDLMFMHDANGSSLAGLGNGDVRRSGDVLCRADARGYMNPYEHNLVRAICERSTSHSDVGSVPVHSLITVKTINGWKVVHSGVFEITTMAGTKKTESYERIPTISDLVGRF